MGTHTPFTGRRRFLCGRLGGVAAPILAVALAGCGRNDVSPDWAGRYAFDSVGSKWAPTSPQVSKGYIDVTADGAVTIVDPPPQWVDPAPPPKIIRGWFLGGIDSQCSWLQNLIGSYCLYLVVDANGYARRESVVVNFTRKSKDIGGDIEVFTPPGSVKVIKSQPHRPKPAFGVRG